MQHFRLNKTFIYGFQCSQKAQMSDTGFQVCKKQGKHLVHKQPKDCHLSKLGWASLQANSNTLSAVQLKSHSQRHPIYLTPPVQACRRGCVWARGCLANSTSFCRFCRISFLTPAAVKLWSTYVHSGLSVRAPSGICFSIASCIGSGRYWVALGSSQTLSEQGSYNSKKCYSCISAKSCCTAKHRLNDQFSIARIMFYIYQ